jgi:hypothetical protein
MYTLVHTRASTHFHRNKSISVCGFGVKFYQNIVQLMSMNVVFARISRFLVG